MKYIKVDNVIHPVNYVENVGFFVDIDGQATTKPTKDELLAELKTRYASAVGLPCTPITDKNA
jgi:adenylate cyclase class IV